MSKLIAPALTLALLAAPVWAWEPMVIPPMIARPTSDAPLTRPEVVELGDCYYSDQGGNIVFVSGLFVLVLQGRHWPHKPDAHVSGSNRIYVKHGAHTYEATSPDEGPVFNLKPGNRLEITFPGMVIAFSDNPKAIEVAGQVLTRDRPRMFVLVAKDGTISTEGWHAPVPPKKGENWMIELRERLSAKWAQPVR